LWPNPKTKNLTKKVWLWFWVQVGFRVVSNEWRLFSSYTKHLGWKTINNLTYNLYRFAICKVMDLHGKIGDDKVRRRHEGKALYDKDGAKGGTLRARLEWRPVARSWRWPRACNTHSLPLLGQRHHEDLSSLARRCHWARLEGGGGATSRRRLEWRTVAVLRRNRGGIA